MPSPPIGPDAARGLRHAAELALASPPRHGIEAAGGRLALQLRLEPFATVLVSVTPYRAAPPTPPEWLDATLSGGNAILRWAADAVPDLLGYELERLDPPRPAAPVPLRGAMWVDTAAGPSSRYLVRAVSMSGLRSAAVPSPALRPG
jgi:hypothetical protein